MNLHDFLVWEQITRDTIDFKRIYVDIAGDLVTGLLLSQILFWFLPGQDGKSKLRVFKLGQYWLAKGRDSWWEECRITPKQFDRASRILEQEGLIEKRNFKFNGTPTMHIKLNLDELLDRVNLILTKGEILDTSRGIPTLTKGENLDTSRDIPTLTKGENPFSPKVNIDFNQTVRSITESRTNNDRLIDSHHQLKKIMQEIRFDLLRLRYDPNDQKRLNNVEDLLREIITSTKDSERIGGRYVPLDQIKANLCKLNSMHIEYVMECMEQTTTKIHNIRNYLLTALYNAPMTIDSYYTAEVNNASASRIIKNIKAQDDTYSNLHPLEDLKKAEAKKTIIFD